MVNIKKVSALCLCIILMFLLPACSPKGRQSGKLCGAWVVATNERETINEEDFLKPDTVKLLLHVAKINGENQIIYDASPKLTVTDHEFDTDRQYYEIQATYSIDESIPYIKVIPLYRNLDGSIYPDMESKGYISSQDFGAANLTNEEGLRFFENEVDAIITISGVH